ncbi:MAG: molybdopterin-binding protein [Acidobacteriota bacterium]|nr:molybdopterin-binding protein [Acidobacteriota bacterium]MDQ7087594.1 molybdopterin-binding protein [Acidobacteriota bacterium]
MNSSRRSALLLIGSELLSGRVQDENLRFLARELWELGVSVERAVMVGDDIEEIATTLSALADRHDWVFTTGGIGPTHDDLTIDAVARAFGVEVVTAPRLEQLIRARWGDRTTAAHLRMARVPRGAVLEGGDQPGWPTVRMENVVILPGVPAILRRKFQALRERFRCGRFHRRSVAYAAEEVDLAPILERVAAKHPAVRIGSYPQEDHVLITLEGRDDPQVQAAARTLEAATGDLPRF